MLGKSTKIQIACLVCGTVVCCFPCNIRKYCSRDCWRIDRKRETKRTCPICGKTFSQGFRSNREQKVCSRACRDKLFGRREKRQCRYCGTSFTVKPCSAKKFCNHRCYGDWTKANGPRGDRHWNAGRTGPLASGWRGGVTAEYRAARTARPYQEWRKAVFERDGYRCQECGDASGGNLRAHHKLTWAKHPEHRYDVANGITLCVTCHMRHHYTVLTPDQVREIRDASTRGETLVVLAARFKVGTSTISRIARRETWADID